MSASFGMIRGPPSVQVESVTQLNNGSKNCTCVAHACNFINILRKYPPSIIFIYFLKYIIYFCWNPLKFIFYFTFVFIFGIR